MAMLFFVVSLNAGLAGECHLGLTGRQRWLEAVDLAQSLPAATSAAISLGPWMSFKPSRPATATCTFSAAVPLLAMLSGTSILSLDGDFDRYLWFQGERQPGVESLRHGAESAVERVPEGQRPVGCDGIGQIERDLGLARW